MRANETIWRRIADRMDDVGLANELKDAPGRHIVVELVKEVGEAFRCCDGLFWKQSAWWVRRAEGHGAVPEMRSSLLSWSAWRLLTWMSVIPSLTVVTSLNHCFSIFCFLALLWSAHAPKRGRVEWGTHLLRRRQHHVPNIRERPPQDSESKRVENGQGIKAMSVTEEFSSFDVERVHGADEAWDSGVEQIQ